MEVARIKNKIKSNKTLIMNDGLILPTEIDIEVAELVLSYISLSDISSEPIFKPSTYDIEMEKVYKSLRVFLPENDVLNKSRQVLNRVSIRPIMPKCTYSSTFKCQGSLPWDLNIPRELDDLSHVYIGHELMHLLKDTNNKEWKNLLSYSEVLPILYEFIQTRYKRYSDRSSIIDYRIKSLLEMERRIEEDSKDSYFINNPSDLIYYRLPEYGYFISFYYATRLYQLYLSYPKEILREMKKVLLHEQTTKELLQHFSLHDDWDLFGFSESYQKVLKRREFL